VGLANFCGTFNIQRMNEPPGITIRDACEKDIPVIARLCAQLGYPSTVEEVDQRYRKTLACEGHKIMVAVTDMGVVVGWIHLLPRVLLLSFPNVEIGGLVVDSEWQRHGIGRLLLRAAETWARAAGFTAIAARSGSERHGAHQFYPKAGFEYVKEQKVFWKALG